MRLLRNHFMLVLIYGTFVVAGAYWVAQWVRFRGVQDWPSVDARIMEHGSTSVPYRYDYWDGTHSGTAHFPHVTFDYTVAGQTYESDLATPDGGGLPSNPPLTIVDQSGQRHSASHKWKASYKPTSPGTAVLVPTPYEGLAWLYTMLVCGILIAIQLACSLPEKLEWLRWRRIAANRRAEQGAGGNGGQAR